MVLCTLMWSIAGVVTRHLQAARGFEMSFWRSAFNALALLGLLLWLRGAPRLMADIRRGGWPLALSSLCWMVMFTHFMLALTLTSVATVLVTMAIAPLLTALFSRLFLRHPLPARTWVAITLAGVGIAWMYGRQALETAAGGGDHLLGALVALGVPLAAATNWTLLQYLNTRRSTTPAGRPANDQGQSGGSQSVAAPPDRPTTDRPTTDSQPPDMLPAVLLGAVMSALICLPLALPFKATPHDLGLLALLGVVQLAIPCLLSVQVSRVLAAPEVSLISLLEVIFGVTWAWLGANEPPTTSTLTGGALVVGALLANELLGLVQRRQRHRRPAGLAAP